jgi:hypothetical protein
MPYRGPCPIALPLTKRQDAQLHRTEERSPLYDKCRVPKVRDRLYTESTRDAIGHGGHVVIVTQLRSPDGHALQQSRTAKALHNNQCHGLEVTNNN